MLRVRLFSVMLAVALVPFAMAEKWRFIVSGDGRCDTKNVRPEDKNGVNVVITKEIADAAMRENARYLLWTGDLVGGASDSEGFEKELMTWRGIMEPLYAKGIKVLPVRGNHETHCDEGVAVWNKVFSGKYGLPQNGPADEKNRSFFVEDGSVLIIGLDQFETKLPSVNQPWLDSVLKDHKKPFIFTQGHEAAFMDGHHKEVMDADPAKRDAFWRSLVKAGARTFFAGHDHLYDHMVITQDAKDPGPELHQFVAGTAGAPYYDPGPYAGVNDGWKIRRVKAIGKTYGYLLVEIDGNKCTITFKGRKSPGVYEAMDTFQYTRA